jgi:hypothetical protein
MASIREHCKKILKRSHPRIPAFPPPPSGDLILRVVLSTYPWEDPILCMLHTPSKESMATPRDRSKIKYICDHSSCFNTDKWRCYSPSTHSQTLFWLLAGWPTLPNRFQIEIFRKIRSYIRMGFMYESVDLVAFLRKAPLVNNLLTQSLAERGTSLMKKI